MQIINYGVLTWSFLRKRTKLFLTFSVFLMPVIALVELIQIFTIFPMVSYLIGKEEVVTIAQYTINTSLLELAIFFAFISITVAILRFTGVYAFNYSTTKALENVSTSIYTQKLYGDFSSEIGKRASDTMSLFSHKFHYLTSAFIFPLMTIFQSVVIILAIIIFLMFNIPEMFLILAGSVILMYGTYTYFSRSLTKSNALVIKAKTQQHASKVADLSQNLRELKLYGREKLTLRKFQEIERELRNREISVQVIAHGSKPIVEGFSYVSIAMVIIFSVQAGYEDLIPKLAMLVFGVQKLLPATQQVYSSYTQMISGKEMIREIFDILFDLKDINNKIVSFRPGSEDASLVDKVTIKNVAYNYYGENSLRYPNHVFRVGDLNLIVGKSGRGKTTLTDLITGLLKPSDGKVEFFCRDKRIKSEIITFAYCSQTPVVFDDDLSFFSDEKTSQEILKDAIDLDFLKNKRDIHVGILSGGERQRIGISRALLSSSNIYIFDEPTAALDDFNAGLLIKKLKTFALSHLVIIVTHDPRVINLTTNTLDLN